MHRRMWKPLMMATLVAGLFGAGCKPQQGPPPMPTPEVAVVAIQPEKVVLTSELPGRTAAYLMAEIRPQVSGLIKKRLFTEGTQVNKGDLLYEIDPAPYQAAYDSALANEASMQQAAERAKAGLNASIAALKRHQATLKLASANRQRYENLVKTSAASAMQRDQAVADVDVADAGLKVAEAQVESDREAVKVAEAAVKQAAAAAETAKINLGYTKITAPITGRIGRSNITEGAIATAYQTVPLATIQQFDPIYVDVTQSTVELSRLRRNLASGRMKIRETDQVKIILEDGTIYGHEGSLQFRDVTVDPTTGSVILRIVVPNPEGILLPNMFVQARVEEGVREQAILVPQQAVSRDPKGNPIALAVDGEGNVQPRFLVTERAMGDKWLVASGLAAGDRVVVEGMQRARPGTKVKVVPLESLAKSAQGPAGPSAPNPAQQPAAKTAEKPAARPAATTPAK